MKKIIISFLFLSMLICVNISRATILEQLEPARDPNSGTMSPLYMTDPAYSSPIYAPANLNGGMLKQYFSAGYADLLGITGLYNATWSMTLNKRAALGLALRSAILNGSPIYDVSGTETGNFSEVDHSLYFAYREKLLALVSVGVSLGYLNLANATHRADAVSAGLQAIYTIRQGDQKSEPISASLSIYNIPIASRNISYNNTETTLTVTGAPLDIDHWRLRAGADISYLTSTSSIRSSAGLEVSAYDFASLKAGYGYPLNDVNNFSAGISLKRTFEQRLLRIDYIMIPGDGAYTHSIMVSTGY